jgi:hypothetical protein
MARSSAVCATSKRASSSAFPGEERGGKLHFMNQADGANYLAVKLFAR